MTTLRVFVAEDDDDDRLLLEEAFEEVDADVHLTFASDGAELLHALAQAKLPAQPLVVLDLNMPRMNGREALSRLRQDPRHRTTPVVILSTSAAPDDVHAVYALGANTYFTKPPRFADLVETIRTLYDYWSARAVLPVALPPS